MDQPSASWALVAGLVGGLLFTVVGGPTRVAARDAPMLVAAEATVAAAPPSLAASTTRAGCPLVGSPRTSSSPRIPPGGSTDRQMNADGMSRAGGVSTLPHQALGDPCEPAKLRPLRHRRASPGAAAASDNATTPR